MKLARRLDRRTALRAKSRRAAIKNQFRRGLLTERLEDRKLLAGDIFSPFLASSNSDYYNYNSPTDVTADGAIAPNDALAVINVLNSDGSHQLATGGSEGESGSRLYVDVDNDGWVSPADALRVINELNAEGEPVKAGDKVEYVFTAVDPTTGQPITSVRAGQTFFVVMAARDLRPEGTYIDDNGTPGDTSDDVERELVRGVYAAYSDLLFDRSEVSAAVFESQTVNFPSGSAGTFKLTVNGTDTANIAFDVRNANARTATVSAMQSALNATLGAGQVEVTNPSLNNFRVRFIGQVNTDVPTMTTKDVVFTAPSPPPAGTITVAETVKGDPTNNTAVLSAVTFSSLYLNGQSALNGTNPDRIDELGAFFSGNTAVGTGTGLVEVLRVLMIANDLPEGVSTEQTVLTPDFTNMVRPSDDTLVFANLKAGGNDPTHPESQRVLSTQIAFNTVTLGITAGPISANPDTNTVLEDAAAITTNVISNDTLNPGASGTIELRTVGTVSPPEAGTATKVGNSIQFAPAANFAGTATITYTAGLVGNSNPDDTASSSLTVTVTAVNDAPAIDAIATQNINEDASPAPTVNLTGIGPGGGPDEAAQVISVSATSSNPSLVAPTVNYTSGSSGTLTLTPGADASGTATITVTVTDDGGTANSGVNTTVRTFTVNVAALNDPPVNLLGGAPVTPSTEELTTPGVALDFNAANGNQLSISDVDAASGNLSTTLSLGAGQGNLTIGSQTAASITLTGTVASINTQLASVRYTPAEGFSGSATLSFVTNDNGNTGGGGPQTSAAANSSITIKLDPGVRPFAVDDRRAIDEGATAVLTIDALANDFKQDGATTTIQSVTQPAAGEGTVQLVGGQIQYTPPGGDFNTTRPQRGPVTFTYVIDDDSAASTGSLEDRTGTVLITINDVNDAPVADNESFQTAIGTALTVPARGVLEGDTDLDDPAASLVAVNAQIAAGQGSVTLNQDGSFTYTPPSGVGGDFTFTYQARDPLGALSNTATVSIHVAAPPQAQNDTATAVEDGANQQFPSVLANDTDPTENQPLTAVLVSNVPASAGSVTLNSNGTWTYNPAANFNTTRPPASPVTFTYKATAGGRDSNVATVSITVTEVNDNPTAVDDSSIAVKRSGSPPNEIGVDQDIVPNVLLNDTFAPDVNETLKVTGVNGATADASGNTAAVPTTLGGSVRLVNFQIKYTAPAVTGNDTITYTVSDFDATTGTARGGSDTGTVTVEVVDFVPKTISGTVYVDADNDGVVDSGEKPLSGVDLRLTGVDFTNAAVDILVSTDINGNYTIPGASLTLKPPKPGTVYTLTQIQPEFLLSGLDTNSTNNAQVTNTSRSDNVFTMSWAITDTSGNITGLNFGERGVDVVSLSDSSGFMHEFLASSGKNGFIMAIGPSGTYWSWTLEGDQGAWAGAASVSASLSPDLRILTLRVNGQTVNLTQNYSIPGSTARFRILGIGSNGQYIIRVDGSADGATDGMNMNLAAAGGAGGEGEGEGSAEAYAGSADMLFAQQAWA